MTNLKNNLQKGEVYSMLKLLLILIFAIILIGGVYQIFSSLFKKSDTSDIISILKTIDIEGQKMTKQGKIVGLNDYKTKITSLSFGQVKVDNLFVTYSGKSIFSGNNHQGVDLDGYGKSIENSLLTNEKSILNLVFNTSGTNLPISFGNLQLDGNEFKDSEMGGFGVDVYYVLFKKDNVIVDELIKTNSNIYEKLDNIYIYNETTKKFDIKVSGLKLKI